MPRNGTGTYSLPAGNPVVNGTTIDPTVQNNTMSDVGSEITNSICKDGQTVPTANLPMGGFKHTGVATGTNANDYATVAQLTSRTGSYVGTVGGTADVITLTPSPAITAYAAGQRFSFIASGNNTTNVTVNVSGLGAKALTKFGSTALIANNIISGSLITIDYDGTRFQLVNVSILPDSSTFTGNNTFSASNTFTPVQYFTAGLGRDYLNNIGLSASVSSKALTIAIKTKALADASATDPGQVTFRNATATTGDYVVRNMTAATSVVAPSGAQLGMTASQTGYVFVYALDNAGTIEAVVSGSNNWDESIVQSTTAISSSADSATVLYSTTSRSNVAIRYLGMIKIQTGAVAGEWDNAPTLVTVSSDQRGVSQGLTVASNGTTDIWGYGGSCHISGTTTITSFGTAPYAGASKLVVFDGALTLTHGANLNILGSTSITTAAGDYCLVYADTTTQFDIVYYSKYSGGNSGLATIASGSLSGASVTVTSIPQDYSSLIIFLSGASSTSAARMDIQLSTNNGSSYDTTAANYSGYIMDITGAAAATSNSVASATMTASTVAASNTADVMIQIDGYQAGPHKNIRGRIKLDATIQIASGAYISTSAVNALKLIPSAGTFDAGTYAIYGVK